MRVFEGAFVSPQGGAAQDVTVAASVIESSEVVTGEVYWLGNEEVRAVPKAGAWHGPTWYRVLLCECDLTAEEIRAAALSGKYVVITDDDGEQMQLSYYDDEYAYFYKGAISSDGIGDVVFEYRVANDGSAECWICAGEVKPE